MKKSIDTPTWLDRNSYQQSAGFLLEVILPSELLNEYIWISFMKFDMEKYFKRQYKPNNVFHINLDLCSHWQLKLGCLSLLNHACD